MNSIANLTPQQLRNAAEIQERIHSLQAELSDLLGSESAGLAEAPVRRRRMSAEGLANIRAGARRRWASFGIGSPTAPKRKRKGGMSAAGRARVRAAIKARWAAAKRAGRNAL